MKMTSMMLVMMMTSLVIQVVISISLKQDISRDRTCCRNTSGSIIHNHSTDCNVLYDSKNKESSHMSREECLSQEFKSSDKLGDSDSPFPFYVVSYPFKDYNQVDSHFTGIDLRYQFGIFSHLNFRIKNTNSKVCPHKNEDADHQPVSDMSSMTCKPRCVDITVDKTIVTTDDLGEDASTFLSYDCEAGFYVQNRNWVSSSLHDYELSVCSDDKCGVYLFQLPDINNFTRSRTEQSLVLVDKMEYEREDILVVLIPTDVEADVFNIQVIREVDNITEAETVHNINVTKLNVGAMQRVSLDSLSLSSGRYQVLVTPILQGVMMTSNVLQSVHLTRPSYGQHALAFLMAILVTVFIVGAILSVYKQWQSVAEHGAVEPGALVTAGRMETQNILIITPLDNPDHVEVVKMLCRYLKDWCGVGKTYFAFDEVTGIGVTQNDPWKWCQETGEQVKNEGHVVYIAGPDPSLSNNTSIFPNLEQNQAFVTTRHLQTMGDEGRVLVAKFGYSNIKTVPQEVPAHLKSSSLTLPKQMNEFLVKLLQVKKKALCRLLPCPVVKPYIKPSNLSRTGGQELINRINELCIKDAKHRQAMTSAPIIKNAQEPQHNKKTSNIAAAAETAALLSKEIENLNKNSASLDKTLNIELEPNLPSVKTMDDRDRFDVET